MPHAPDLSGHALDERYELHAILGEGAFGRVYEGFDRRLARSVAVKVIKPWWAEDPEWLATFERETRLLARMSDPGIIRIYDVGHAPEGLYYVSELVDGTSLAARLRRGPLPAWEACEIAAQLCRALAGAHAQRVVHRDVKPANIMLSREGRVKVGDFGVARLAEGSTDGRGSHQASIVGTPRYMAPEQGRGLPTTPATDVYGAGVVLYEMLCGAPPFSATSVVELALLHLQEPPPPLPARLPASLVAITERALAKDPTARYANGAEMADALLAASTRAADRADRADRAPRADRRELVGAGTPTDARRPASLWSRGDGVPTGPPNIPIRTPPTPTPPPSRPRGPHGTRRAAQYSPRRNVNPSRRRRAIAAVGVVVALLVAMVAAALVIGHTTYSRVPGVLHRTESHALSALRRAHLRVSTHRRYDATAPAGTVVGESPRGGSRVARGTTVHLTISRGPAPVQVLSVVHQDVADAQSSLRRLGLRTTVNEVASPGTAPGTVVGQTPAGGLRPRGSMVTLNVAEVPRWRTVTTFSGASSGPVHIVGTHWRIVYRMAFQGTCTFILFCSGPTARVTDAAGHYVAGFGLQNGTNQVQTFATGKGTYDVRVTPGGDQAGWTAQIQDDY